MKGIYIYIYARYRFLKDESGNCCTTFTIRLYVTGNGWVVRRVNASTRRNHVGFSTPFSLRGSHDAGRKPHTAGNRFVTLSRMQLQQREESINRASLRALIHYCMSVSETEYYNERSLVAYKSTRVSLSLSLSRQCTSLLMVITGNHN